MAAIAGQSCWIDNMIARARGRPEASIASIALAAYDTTATNKRVTPTIVVEPLGMEADVDLLRMAEGLKRARRGS